MCVCVCACAWVSCKALSHLVRMSVNHISCKLLVCSLPSRNYSVSGQKCRWNDLLLRAWRKIGLGDDWRSKAMYRNQWKISSGRELSLSTRDRRHERRSRRMRGSADVNDDKLPLRLLLSVSILSASFLALGKAGLTNHTWQKLQQS